jgi:4-alpha-glucanotransferase
LEQEGVDEGANCMEPVITNAIFTNRQAGVLLHPTSLPGPGPAGDLGDGAFHFVNFLADCQLQLWQMLPIGPPQGGLSPYQTSSAHAGNPQLIGLEPLIRAGWLPEDSLSTIQSPQDKLAALYQAWTGFQETADDAIQHQLASFVQEQAYWLEDYVLFQAISQQRQLSWWKWPKGLRTRERRALNDARRKLAPDLAYLRWQQFIFFRQWQALRAHAHQAGIMLFGDMPIFVAHDSAEVWAQPHNFDLHPDGQLRVVAGVPPDYFSETGQRWGNPLYRWDQLQTDGFQFWIERIQTQLQLFDLIRIDHFRGFQAYWEIPAEADTAISGTWVTAPGDALFTRLREFFGSLPLVAEDLGVITEEVEQLRDDYYLPGMKILQFAFDGSADNPYLPYHHSHNSVVYTGTHDNDTTLGWYQSLDEQQRARVDDYVGYSQEAMPWPLLRLAWASVAKLAIVPMQDLLELDSQHRMNRPGTIEGNWMWRFAWDDIAATIPERVRHLITLYGRASQS